MINFIRLLTLLFSSEVEPRNSGREVNKKMSEIVTAILAIAVAAQVAIMAKAGKDILNSGLRKNMYGRLEASGAHQAGLVGETGGSAELESETEIGYTYTDDQNYGHKDDENEAEKLEANAESKHSLKLSL